MAVCGQVPLHGYRKVRRQGNSEGTQRTDVETQIFRRIHERTTNERWRARSQFWHKNLHWRRWSHLLCLCGIYAIATLV